MSIEMRMLAWAMVLGLVQLLLAATSMTMQRGSRWNASARDGTPAPLTGVAGRFDRAFRNFMETFPFFAAAVLAAAWAQRLDSHTALGAQLYFWARVVYIPLYAAGIPYVRSLVWTIAMIGIVLVLWPLLH